jgi:hypothetical protein
MCLNFKCNYFINDLKVPSSVTSVTVQNNPNQLFNFILILIIFDGYFVAGNIKYISSYDVFYTYNLTDLIITFIS